MKATSPKEMHLFDTLVAALSGCPRCDWDEAEGGLVNHCAKCQFKVTAAAWEFAQHATLTKPTFDRPQPRARKSKPTASHSK